MFVAQDPRVSQQAPLGTVEGCTLTYISATTIAIAAGRAFVQVGALRLPVVLPNSISRTINQSWTLGGPGGLGSSVSLAPNTTYHVFLIRRDSDGAVDVYFDTSISAANRPSGWNARFLGAIITDGGNAIRPFVQQGNQVNWQSSIEDVNSTNYSTASANLQALTVPSGISVEALLWIRIERAGTSIPNMNLRSPSTTDPNLLEVRSAGQSFTAALGVPVRIRTNTSRQIGAWVPSNTTAVRIETVGFVYLGGIL